MLRWPRRRFACNYLTSQTEKIFANLYKIESRLFTRSHPTTKESQLGEERKNWNYSKKKNHIWPVVWIDLCAINPSSCIIKSIYIIIETTTIIEQQHHRTECKWVFLSFKSQHTRCLNSLLGLFAVLIIIVFFLVYVVFFSSLFSLWRVFGLQ